VTCASELAYALEEAVPAASDRVLATVVTCAWELAHELEEAVVVPGASDRLVADDHNPVTFVPVPDGPDHLDVRGSRSFSVDDNLVPQVVEAGVESTPGLGSEEQKAWANAHMKPSPFYLASPSHASSVILYYEIASFLLESWRSGAQKGRVLYCGKILRQRWLFFSSCVVCSVVVFVLYDLQ
jgi:hypothetical protein